MEFAADGDLFKVILRFPEAGEDSARERCISRRKRNAAAESKT